MRPNWTELYNESVFRSAAAELLREIQDTNHVEQARARLFSRVTRYQFDTFDSSEQPHSQIVYVRDCARALRSVLKERSDELAGFSVTQALHDLARAKPRPDLGPGFFAELTHMVGGLLGRVPEHFMGDLAMVSGLEGRQAALARSDKLDELWQRAEATMARYADGLSDEAHERRVRRRDHICAVLGCGLEQWHDPFWQMSHVVRDVEQLRALVTLTNDEAASIAQLRRERLPFGVTPYYLSLMDDEPMVRDRAVRAQVFPPHSYVTGVSNARRRGECSLDFMGERDTSPIDLITRRYPGIVILKPFNTCPQICVYCQRNWEITDAMMEGALAPESKIQAAIDWIADHPAVNDVLVTGGDPLGLPDDTLMSILQRVAAIPSVERIRIGTRTPVTVPMRLTPALVERLASLRMPGRREVCVTTHVEHPYELSRDLVQAVERLRTHGIPVYNQSVYTFFVSRRFEAVLLRRRLRVCGIDPYYTFNAKGKEETAAYRVPTARLLQEQQEEARLLPGLARTDEAVFNVPRLGKNYMRGRQHRDLLSILPSGERVYEWHPWEKGITEQVTYVGKDVSVLDYLTRLADIGEDPADYRSLWFYY